MGEWAWPLIGETPDNTSSFRNKLPRRSHRLEFER
jgi:hypothetical protein